MAPMTPFQTTFAVPMTCESCIKDISGSLSKLSGITQIDVSLEKQIVSIEGTAAPSAIVAAIQATGRDAILRGSGTSNSAAVCILETFSDTVFETFSNTVSEKVKGLVRLVQVSPNLTIVDLTVRGLSPGKYAVTVRETGDISGGALSTGGIWKGSDERGDVPRLKPRGAFGVVEVGRNGLGSVFLDKPIQIWEMIGRSMVISKQHNGKGKFEKNDQDTLVGVIARSAGVWDNDKTVCSCSGKTLWEERQDEKKKGMI